MKKLSGLIVTLTLSFSGFASAEVILANPAAVAAGTEVTHAYEGASFYRSTINKAHDISYGSVYAVDAPASKPAVAGQHVFGSRYADNSYSTVFGEEMWFASTLKAPVSNNPGTSTYGPVLLVDFDNDTNYFKVVASDSNSQTDFFIDMWDASKNWLGRCTNYGEGTDGGCTSKILSAPQGETANQGDLPLWELSFSGDTSSISFISLGGSDGYGFVRSVAYSVPEPAPMALLALGMGGLLLGRRKPTA